MEINVDGWMWLIMEIVGGLFMFIIMYGKEEAVL